MPQNIVTTVYTYDELSPEAQAKARDWYRDGNPANEFFHESVYEDAITCFKYIGYTIDKIYYSGFSCQGDGACFEGSWRASDVQPGKLKEHAPLDEELHRIAEAVEKMAKEFPNSSLRVKHRGHYYHEYCTELDFDIQFPEPDLSDSGPYAYDIAEDAEAAEGRGMEVCELRQERAEQDQNSKIEDVEKELTELSRDCMKWIYRQLEKEYEYQNSDECVIELIQANEYTFTESGRRFG
jgi:hypothetical protein